jgi:hypothetical protein
MRAANSVKVRAMAGRPGAAKHREAAFASIAVRRRLLSTRLPPDDD